MIEPLFQPYHWDQTQKAKLDRDGHLMLPGLLTQAAQEKLIAALAHVNNQPNTPEHRPKHYAAEHHEFLASLIGHPQLRELTHRVLGQEIRYDHCVDLSRQGSDPGQSWHTHSYADDQPELGFIRIFFYVNGFEPQNGGLRVVPGSHLLRLRLRSASDEELRAEHLAGKTHPLTDAPFQLEDLSASTGTVIVMWTHALHAVSPRHPESDTRWAVVYAYRNPGASSHARWVSEAFEQSPPVGAEGLMSLY